MASLKAENATLKARLRGNHSVFQPYNNNGSGSYGWGNGGNSGGGRGNRGTGNFPRSFQLMTGTDKQAITCSAWNATATPGGYGGCSNPEVNGSCQRNGQKLRHGCSVMKPGSNRVCWDRDHTAVGHV